ncbi:hypothetical protein D8B25_00005 [Verminephrobacter aporrectodeae subsp. tuberculatae]|nr:hypothetical protein [Verminephrobacter aporrectodeae subsp. tuberculatae]MCW8171436.1 hypothetical protein [Verminephrobacter aporrectodeae subsp. tuberculatae]MCW8173796.1 hypothetical protein [Verminephrobacter aporrectodeae subsp. tuberculatae]MCW8201367.1 hypothetical protein [Verminephrobacter aporrectodeae subsp. tuberculatae]
MMQSLGKIAMECVMLLLAMRVGAFLETTQSRLHLVFPMRFWTLSVQMATRCCVSRSVWRIMVY